MDGNEEQKNDQLKAVQTYQADVEQAIKEKNLSRTQVFVAEQKKKNEDIAVQERGVVSVPRSFNIRAIIIAFIVLLLAAGGGYYFIFAPKKEIAIPIITNAKPEDSIISYDSYFNFPFPQNNRAGLLSQIESSKNNISTKGIEIVSFDTTSDQFLSLLNPNISGTFLRSIDPDYVFGLVVTENTTGPKPFIVLKTNNYSSSRGSLLSEEGNFATKIGDLFTIPNNQNLHFKDLVLENHDVRALVDAGDNIYYLYSFIDGQTLVIATDDDTFKYIIERISEAKR